MHKCKNCETEFEGNFCPECGTKFEQDVCPNCGAEVKEGVRFCSNCGYFLFHEEKESNQRKSEAERQPSQTGQPVTPVVRQPIFTAGMRDKICTLLYYIPQAVGTLFALLLFAFFAAPIAKVAVEGLGSESAGNIYTAGKELLINLPELKNAVTAMWIGFGIMLAAAGFGVAMRFVPRLRKVFRLPKGIYISTTELDEGILSAGLLYFFIVACSVAGKIGALDEGAGVLKSGAGTVLILGFAIIFFVFAVGAMVWRYLLVRLDDKAGLNIRSEKKFTVERLEKKRADRSAAMQKELENPETVERIKNLKRPAIWDEKLINKLKSVKRISLPIVCILMPLAMLIALGVSGWNGYSLRVLFPCSLGVWGAVAIVGIVVACRPCAYTVGGPKLRQGCGLIGAKILGAIVTLAVFTLGTMGMAFPDFEWYGALNFFAILPYGTLFLFYAAIDITAAVRKREYNLYYYGTKKPQWDTKPIVTESAEVLAAQYRRDKALRRLYVQQGGKLTASRQKQPVSKFVLGAVAACLAVLFLLPIFAIPQYTNPLLVNCVEKIGARNDEQYLTYVFGLYHGGRDGGSSGKWSNKHGSGICDPDESVLQWFDPSLNKLMKRADRAAENLKAAKDGNDAAGVQKYTEELAVIREQVAQGKFTALTVDMNSTLYLFKYGLKDPNGKVGWEVSRCFESVRLDKRFGSGEKKEVKKVCVESIVCVYSSREITSSWMDTKPDTEVTAVYFRAYYTDGSYQYAPVPQAAIDASADGVARFSDDWGEYEVRVK